MLIKGVEYPLGQYVYNDASKLKYTNGTMANVSLYDEMFIVDQQIDATFSATQLRNTTTALVALTRDFTFDKEIAVSPYSATGVWNAGTNRGQILSALATQGDYFTPWFGNDAKFHMIRSLDPAKTIPTFDWDTGNVVLLGSPIESNNLLNAPNRFIVVSNSGDALASPVVGRFDVPLSAPHSIANRGFVILDVTDAQAVTAGQAQAMARNLALNNTIVEQREISTPPDPRHDSYDVIHWDGDNWLEVAWSMSLVEGGSMTHVLQKLYAS